MESGTTAEKVAEVRASLTRLLRSFRGGSPLSLCQKLRAVLDEDADVIDEGCEVPASGLLSFLTALARETSDVDGAAALLDVVERVVAVLRARSRALLRAAYVDAVRMIIDLAVVKGRAAEAGPFGRVRVGIFRGMVGEGRWPVDGGSGQAGRLGASEVLVECEGDVVRLTRAACRVYTAALLCDGDGHDDDCPAPGPPPAFFEALREMLRCTEAGSTAQADLLIALGWGLRHGPGGLLARCVLDALWSVEAVIREGVGRGQPGERAACGWEAAVLRVLETLVDALERAGVQGVATGSLCRALVQVAISCERNSHLQAHLLRVLKALAVTTPLLAVEFEALLPLLGAEDPVREVLAGCVRQLVDTLPEDFLSTQGTVGGVDEEMEDVIEDVESRDSLLPRGHTQPPIVGWQANTVDSSCSHDWVQFRRLEGVFALFIASLFPDPSGPKLEKLRTLLVLITAASGRPHINLLVALSRACELWFQQASLASVPTSPASECSRILEVALALLVPTLQALSSTSCDQPSLQELSSLLAQSIPKMLNSIWAHFSKSGAIDLSGAGTEWAERLKLQVLQAAVAVETLGQHSAGARRPLLCKTIVHSMAGCTSVPLKAAIQLVTPVVSAYECQALPGCSKQSGSHSGQDLPSAENCLQQLASHLDCMDETVRWATGVSLGMHIMAFNAATLSQWVDVVHKLLQLLSEVLFKIGWEPWQFKTGPAVSAICDDEGDLVVKHLVHLSTWEPFCKALLADGSSTKVKAVVFRSIHKYLVHANPSHIMASQAVLDLIFQAAIHECAVLPSETHRVLLALLQERVMAEWARGSHEQQGALRVVEALKDHLARAHEANTTAILQQLAALHTALMGQEAAVVTVQCLLENINSSKRSVSAMAESMLMKVADQEGVDLATLLLGSAHERCSLSMSSFLATRHQLLHEVASLLDESVEHIAALIIPNAIGYIGAIQDYNALRYLAQILGMSPQQLLLGNFHFAMSFVLWNNSASEFAAFKLKLLGPDNTQFLHHMEPYFGAVVAEIMWAAGEATHWSGHEDLKSVAILCHEKLHTFLRICGYAEPDLSDLKGRVAGFFVKLSKTFEFSKESYAARLQAWRALSVFVTVMRSQLMPHIPQVLAALRTGLVNEPDVTLRRLGVEACASFVDILQEHAPHWLGTIIGQVVVALLPALQDGNPVCKEVCSIIEDLQAFEESHPGKGYCLPPLLSLERLTHIRADQSISNSEKLKAITSSLRHDSLAIRLLCLESLRELMGSSRDWVKQQESRRTRPADLMCALLQACIGVRRTSKGVELHRRCAECLGLLGALDPSRVRPKLLTAHLTSALLTNETEFLTELVQTHLVRILTSEVAESVDNATSALEQIFQAHLVRILTSEVVESVDNAASALEQIFQVNVPVISTQMPAGGKRKNKSRIRSQLKTPGSTQDSATLSTQRKSSEVFDRLPENIRELLNVYRTVRCNKAPVVAESTDTPRSQLTLRSWLFAWLLQLRNAAAGPLADVFGPIVMAVRFDITAMMFVLPFLAYSVMAWGGDAACQSLQDEITAILQESCVRDAGTKLDSEKLQVVFMLLDSLKTWLEVAAKGNGGTGGNAQAALSRVSTLLGSIDRKQLAEVGFLCGAHARAFRYFEAHILAASGCGLNPAALCSPQFSEEEISFLLQIYSQMDEPDGVHGLVHMRKGGLEVQDQIMVAQKAGLWDKALSLYEHAVVQGSAGHMAQDLVVLMSQTGDTKQIGPCSQSESRQWLRISRTRCLAQAGRLLDVLAHAQSPSNGDCPQIRALGVAAAWRLGQWADLDECLANLDFAQVQQPAAKPLQCLNPQEDWEVRVGRILSSMHKHDYMAIHAGIQDARTSIMKPLAAAATESYSRAYPLMVRLHMLQELEDACAIIERDPHPGPIERARMLRWEERLEVVEPSVSTQEPILALRRQLALWMDDTATVARCWLLLAKSLRAASQYGQANFAAMMAVRHRAIGSELESVKLLWCQNQHHQAIQELQHTIATIEAQATQAARSPSPHYHAKLVLQLARWKSETRQESRETLTSLFERSMDLDRTWSKPALCLARYLCEVYADARKRQVAVNEGVGDRLGGKAKVKLGEDKHYVEYLPQVLKNYGIAVKLGQKRVMQSLSRMLTLYFEHGDDIMTGLTSTSVPGLSLSNVERTSRHVHQTMQDLGKSVPSFYWLMVLPTLVSRLRHPHVDVKDWIKRMISLITEAHPHQALWHLASVYRSRIKARRKTAADVITQVRSSMRTQRERAAIDDFLKLLDQLINLCHKEPPTKNRAPVRQMSSKQHFSELLRLLPVDVIVPVRSAFVVNMPHSAITTKGFKPLGEVVTIAQLKDDITVMASLQAPKKIIFIGSDGHEYPFLAKPKDDLRKDYRLMEFCGVMNTCLSKQPDSSRRRLRLRTFAVLPLTEDCGILEWINNLKSLRSITEGLYTAEGLFNGGRDGTRKWIDKTYKSLIDRPSKAEWLEVLLERFPPRMNKWFALEFPSPAAWFNARLNFTRSTAVWSMVGHSIGLGDRHGENITVDGTTGDCIHVDFGMLFDKGLVLTVPEIVPFRLTQNMIDGFGVSGVEGVYRKCAEISLQVLRENREALLTCVESFLHDPLVEWSGRQQGEDEVENPHAKDALETMEGRVNGTLLGAKSVPSLALSYESHAHRLIEEATSRENLGRMYIWWMPWL